jgi:hypothetical protein
MIIRGFPPKVVIVLFLSLFIVSMRAVRFEPQRLVRHCGTVRDFLLVMQGLWTKLSKLMVGLEPTAFRVET